MSTKTSYYCSTFLILMDLANDLAKTLTFAMKVNVGK